MPTALARPAISRDVVRSVAWQFRRRSDSTAWSGVMRLASPVTNIKASKRDKLDNSEEGALTMALTRKQIDSDAKAAKAAQPAQVYH
jgi:hypothetical protein